MNTYFFAVETKIFSERFYQLSLGLNEFGCSSFYKKVMKQMLGLSNNDIDSLVGKYKVQADNLVEMAELENGLIPKLEIETRLLIERMRREQKKRQTEYKASYYDRRNGTWVYECDYIPVPYLD